MWHICLTASIGVLIAVIAFLLWGSRGKGTFKPLVINTLIVGVFFSSVILFVPIYAEEFAADGLLVRIFKTVIISMHHTIRLFIVDSDFDIIRNIAIAKNGTFYNIYSCYAALLFIMSPALTFGVVLSFFKNASAYRGFIKSYNKNLYVFSAINEKSLALAESIKNNYKNAKIIFTDAEEQNEDGNILVAKAKDLKAVCFKNDILSVNFNFHSPKKKVTLFFISDSELDNERQALTEIERYKNRDKTLIYVFSNSFESEILLSNVHTDALKVRRVSDIRTLIYSQLSEKGELLFAEAEKIENDDEKHISAVIVGVGGYGTEAIKSLVWFGQMDGYKIEITAFDYSDNAREKFSALCPELMNDKYNNRFSDNGESRYKIEINNNTDVNTGVFYEKMLAMPCVTYILVALGSDEENIKTAIKLRTLFLKKGKAPRIQAIVYGSERKIALCDVTNYSGQKYDIDFIGDIQSFYSVGKIIDSDLEAEALVRHLKWGKEEDFWKYEYNYRSSIASALHKRMKIVCKIPGILKPPAERTESERLKLQMLEHRRWNTYMRSEGFTYAPVRNNLAKTHNCLVTYNDLSPEEKKKDDD